VSAAGRLVVLSGPSGSGKSTVVARALSAGDVRARVAVSATTRPPRPGEHDGVDYHFWTPRQFEQGVREGRFLEWAEVHGNRYGTLKSEVEPFVRQGLCVILEIDVQGARQIRRQYPDCLMVFLRTSSLAEYERRLRQRGTEDEPAIRRRLAAVEAELAAADEYDVYVINDDLESAVTQLRELLKSCGGT
jgi:guanylate kinase